jgi:hypothetical protein
MKKLLTSKRYVKPYNIKWTPNILIDTSTVHGCGYLQYQEPKNRTQQKVNLIKCGSVAAGASWTCMGPLELKSSGFIWWSLNYCNFYVRGSPLVMLNVDHMPLVGFLQGPLGDLSERMLRMLAEMLNYKIQVIYTPGRRHLIADCLGK